MKAHHPRKALTPAVGAVVAALALAGGVAACGSSSSSGSGSSSSGSSGSGAPNSASFKWGTFKLNSRIADKVKSKQPLNFVLSFQILNEPGGPAQLTAGMKEGAALVKAKYGVTINTKLIGPPETDPPTQISQLREQVASGQVDCGGVEPVTPGAFVSVINEAVQQGVPMMTVNTDSAESKRFAYYGADDDADPASPLEMGKIAGHFTVNWAKAHNVDLNGKQVALVTGDTTASWAQARMKGWIDTVKAAFPSVQVVGSPTNALTTGYTPADILSKASSFMTGHPNIAFYFDSDWGAAQIGQLIQRGSLQGKTATIGYNIDPTYVQDLQKKLIIATIDQRYDLQAKNFVLGCANFLLGGKVPPEFNFVKPSIWTPNNVATALKVYSKIPNSGV
jgi:ABC-type sugar transport system substrate-binding protein